MHVPSVDRLSIQSPEQPSGSEEGTSPEADETRGRPVATGGASGRRRTIIDTQNAEITKLKIWRDRYWKKYRAARDRVVEVEDDIKGISRIYRETTESQAQRIRALEDELARTKELLAAKTTEPGPVTPSFPSTTIHPSEGEVMGLVRNLNENIFQVAANLTEEWEKYRTDRSSRFKITKKDVEALSQTFGSALVYCVLERDPAAVNFLVQSCICDHAAWISSGWQYKEGSKTLVSVNNLPSASEGQTILARRRCLTHNGGHLSESPSEFSSITHSISEVLWMTGSFPSIRNSSDFVKTKASKWIETIERLALRLESIFMQDTLSCDMCLLYEAPSSSVFDAERMTREVESDDGPIPRGQGKVAGTTEVGLEKSVSLGRGKGRRTQILLKTKVVLEEDLVDLRKPGA